LGGLGRQEWQGFEPMVTSLEESLLLLKQFGGGGETLELPGVN
jgi:hypothetical protein